MSSDTPDPLESRPDIVPPPRPDMAFFLDFDGTLSEIVPRPETATLSERARRALAALDGLTGGAVALVSGRSIWDLDRLLSPMKLPLAGQHGVERRGRAGLIVKDEVNGRAIAEIERCLEAFTRHDPRLILERKGFSVAVHYRAAPEREAELDATVAALLAEIGPDFMIQPGKMVREVKPRGSHKGGAIAAFMAEAPFLGRLPVFAGDDATDEDGFAAIAEFGGVSIKIGPGETRARYRLPDTDALIAWLERLGETAASAATPEAINSY